MYCSRCKADKGVADFWKKTNSKTGYNNWCKQCCRDSQRVSIKSNINIIEGQLRNISIVENKILEKDNKRMCSTCKNYFVKNTNKSTRCNSCERIRGKEQRAKHKARDKARRKKYYEANKERLKANRREYYKQKVKELKDNK